MKTIVMLLLIMALTVRLTSCQCTTGAQDIDTIKTDTHKNNNMTAIVYSSKYGTTEKICETIRSEMHDSDSVELITLEGKTEQMDLSQYRCVILGTSIYAGKPRRAMVEFCKRHEKELMQARLALFVCGMDRGNAIKEIEAAYPASLLNHSLSTTFFEGEYRLDKMKLPDRMLLRVFFKVRESKMRDYKNDVRTFLQTFEAIR